jgi:virginiamycin B lyase
MRCKKWLVLAIFSIISAPLAHVTPAATISGTVKGPDGGPFEGAFVGAQNSKTRITVSVLSDKQGHYLIPNLAAGDYEIRIRAVGYKADPVSSIALTDAKNGSADFALQNGVVRWSDISLYQGEQLLPDTKGKTDLFKTCFACHGFESRMAAVTRDESGWRDRVNFMVTAMHFFIGGRFSDQEQENVVTYLTSTFGPDSTKPKSPTDMPKYQDVKQTFPSDAMNIVYTEYELPGANRMPWSAAPDKSGYFWMPYYGDANHIGRLDPKTGKVDEYQVANQGTAAIHSAQPAPDGSVWFTEQGSDKIGKWDPTTKEITEYQDPQTPGKEGTTAGGSKHTLRIEPNGDVWSTGGPVSKFDPKTKQFTDIKEIPSAYGIALAKDGTVWFAEFTPDGKIGKVDPQTLKVTKYAVPTPNARPRRIQVDDTDGSIWFCEFEAGKIGHFDPKTEQFKEYPLPGAKPTPYAMNLDREHHVWFSSESMDYIGRLDPKTGNVIEYPFDHPENTMREFFLDDHGRMWYGTPANNKVGYFYLAGNNERASK